MKAKQPRLRVLFGFNRLSDTALLSRGRTVVSGMTRNPAYPTPPVDPEALETALDKLEIAIANAAYRDKRTIAEKNRLRAEVSEMLRLLAQYVENACNRDLPALVSSGFDVASTTRTAPQPLEPATIKTIDHGSSGQLLVKVNPNRNAWSYEVRFAALDAAGIPGPWTSQPITAVVPPTPCAGLTPGSTYHFQVRALGRLGYTDWSHPVAKICT